MATGYCVTNGSVKALKTYNTTIQGITFGTQGMYNYTPSGAHIYTYVKYVANGGFIGKFNTGDMFIDYPSPFTATSGTVYVSDGNDFPHVWGQISTFTYYTINLEQSSGGTLSGGGVVDEGGSVTVTATPSYGYYLESFNGDTSCAGPNAVTKTFYPTADMTVTAVFKPMYVVSYNKNGGSGTPILQQRVYPGDSVTIDSGSGTTWSSHIFDGWTTSAKGAKVYEGGETITPTGDIKLYAHWLSCFYVKYNANGGTGTMEEQSFVYGQTQALRDNAFTRSGYVFTGWNSRADGTGTAKANKADGSRLSSTAGATVTLYAQWRLPNVAIRRANVNSSGSSADSVGTIKVTNQNGVTVASSSDGICRFEGYNGATYTVTCSLDGYDASWTSKGVLVSGEYYSSYSFSKGSSSVDITYYFEEKRFYSVTTESNVSGCTASVTNPSSPDKNGKYAEGRTITLTASPKTGYELESVNFINASTGSSIGDISEPTSNSFSFPNLSCDLNVYVNFKAKSMRVLAKKDANSSSAISSVAVVQSGAQTSSVDYGSTVTFTATLASGYEFEGWYLNGTKVGQFATHTRTITADTTLVAKAKVNVRLRIKYNDNRPSKTPSAENTCSISANGSDNIIGTPFYITLGDSFDYAVKLGKVYSGSDNSWLFAGWTKIENNTDTGEYVPMSQSGTIKPTSSIDAMVHVNSYIATNVLSIKVIDEEDESVINPQGLNIVPSITPTAKEEHATETERTFTYDGTQNLKFTMRSSFTKNGEKFYLSGVYSGEELISNGTSVEYVLSANATLNARYGSSGNRTVSVAYGAGDRSMGSITAGGNAPDDSGIASVSKPRGSVVSICAVPKNGYKFMGWYASEQISGSPLISDSSSSVTVTTNVIYYAWFMKDTHAVCEWEGLDENKMMDWKSKIYVLPRPINPTCIRVDALGYNLASNVSIQEASVQMFSSPSAEPTAIATLNNIVSQTVRRLPIRRMEKYLQVEVKDDNEVDAIIVGTSPGGLAV